MLQQEIKKTKKQAPGKPKAGDEKKPAVAVQKAIKLPEFSNKEKWKLDQLKQQDLYRKMEFKEDQTEFRLNKYFDQFKTPAFEDDNRTVGDTQQKIAMFERENAPKFVTEQSLIADLLTITKQ